VGDELLKEVARRLLAAAPDGATVARLGGDEFAVLLPPQADILAAADAVARDIVAAVFEPAKLSEVTMPLSEATVNTQVSVGIAISNPSANHVDVLRNADTAMYAAKSHDDSIVVYDPELDRGRAERLALGADLQLALSRDELVLHYQPKLDLATGAMSGVEALVRWNHPRLGTLNPETFIPLAETNGLIEQLTPFVLRMALKQCRLWRDAGFDITVAVNLSARNVGNPQLPETVSRALDDAGLPADRLVLEITESSVMDDPERTVPILVRLASTGVTLSLDDFGTGYSSLSYLQRLPVREVKIDRSFVRGLADPDDARASEALIRSIAGLGESLQLNIVAEGVEDAKTIDLLRQYGCDVAQGYFIGRPEPADRITARLREVHGTRPHLKAIAN
jgi:predicted signal transduction protein with EAL and GGDEF domain